MSDCELPAMTRRSIRLEELTRRELTELVAVWGFRPAHAARLWRYIYREGETSFAAMNELPPRLRARLTEDARLGVLSVVQQTHSRDGLTHKYLLGLSDSRRIETVLMHCRGRVTACISSQVGCALGCVFCATGQTGFVRNLSAGEIVAQALHVDRTLRNSDCGFAKGGRHAFGDHERLRNIVLMGMGEPLLNYDAVMRALEILRDSSGLAIAAKRFTLSTVGVIPGIVRLADEARPLSLAVSLHAATQEERAALIPAARPWPLAELMEACRYYTTKLNRRIFFEWTLIEGSNDSPEHARALAGLVRGISSQINLIPLNPTAGFRGAPGPSNSNLRFQAILRDLGFPVTLRRRRGIDINAGCGQLAGAEAAAR
jgi:23S rRNA (adenine2503-C2)-methyltransferase